MARAAAPSLVGLYGKHVQLADGRVITADEAYIRESILQPDAKVVAGFQPLMPTFQGLVTEEGVVQLIEYIKSLSPKPGTGAAPVNISTRPESSSQSRSGCQPRGIQYRRNVRDYDYRGSTATRELLKLPSYGLKSWLLTKDHKRIALLYFFTITLFFFLGGVFATLIRIELLTPQGDLVSAETYNKLFTMHGVIMVFFFLVPSIPATLGNFFLPMMIGARDLAFPRINLLSWYLLIIGGALAFFAMLAGGVDTGWTFYTPYSTTYSNTWVIATALGIFVAGFSSILTGLNFIVTVHRMRAPGMTWFRMPLFVWANYATALIQVLGTPVLAVTLVLVFCERALHIGIFDPALGGDPVLFQHLFWFYSHPAVYIMVLPGMGVISELISIFSRKPVFGYGFVAASSLAIAVIGFLVWGHHLFVSTQSVYAGMVFSFLSYFVAIPSAIKVFNWTATLYKGSISFETPMLYAFGFIGLFTIGGLTGLFLASLGHRRPRHRHLLRDRALPLRHGGRHDHGVYGRAALLVAQDDRPHVSRRMGQALGAGSSSWAST